MPKQSIYEDFGDSLKHYYLKENKNFNIVVHLFKNLPQVNYIIIYDDYTYSEFTGSGCFTNEFPACLMLAYAQLYNWKKELNC
ncbi:hypothetical protein A5482_015130 (plasmid) [Cyanobacterium sp. IPPAS B-1200]|uniref:hypothetical protein n=1 Tax=Cyanobacterium sp. IPPAS B-1200 TaxID=1562720 RepID=UPI00085255F1|nr:hypothetical protein [Cyanobacterium sp. IPPAS B-1200]OEJ78112.1 hypothetical protein A5482_14140 [Cyanobacterium sp. IPPAS B-1200]